MSADAVNSLDNYTLDDVLITATRTERTDLETPASTVVITAKDLEERGENSLFEVIQCVTGIVAESYGTGGEDYVGHPLRLNIRGVDKGTLILINGSSLNLNAQNSMVSAIPIEDVERIEIVKGANSALYGAEAMGGVINIITKTAKKTHTTLGGEWGNKLSDTFISAGTDELTFRYKKEWRAEQDLFNRPSKIGKQEY